ncbi:MAG: type II toxin-antitoxin system prevent-host-death family antitoxin [Kiritimatiellae bacterium]|nr:type II toxin-antitoxin system prevent-host-death family antitoxin [Kiritimatiellia bacterium]
MTAKRKSPAYPVKDTATFSVSEAKAQFSALVSRAAEGEEIVIAWHGQPRARLVPIRTLGNVFRVDRAWLRSMRVRPSRMRAEDLVRADRDGRA